MASADAKHWGLQGIGDLGVHCIVEVTVHCRKGALY